MGRFVIVAFKPKPGQGEALLAEIRQHVPTLRTEGLATDRPAYVMRAGDGTLVEVFEWVSEEAIQQAHTNPAVGAMWGGLGRCVTT